MLTIGHLARTYGQLPSTVLANATTYDMMIDDVYTTWDEHNRNEQTPGRAPEYNTEQLSEILNKSRGEQ